MSKIAGGGDDDSECRDVLPAKLHGLASLESQQQVADVIGQEGTQVG